jgi:UDP-N-acetyl-D-galactosamine dehydrogenase
LGITFKENCPDIRNSRVVDVIEELKDFGCEVDIYDPWADPEEVKCEYGLELLSQLSTTDINTSTNSYDAIVLAVAHNEFKTLDLSTNKRQIVYDIKAIIDRSVVDGRL